MYKCSVEIAKVGQMMMMMVIMMELGSHQTENRQRFMGDITVR